jgi:hypothetical protein
VKGFDGEIFNCTGYKFLQKKEKFISVQVAVVELGTCTVFFKGVPYICEAPFKKKKTIASAILVDNIDVVSDYSIMKNLLSNLIGRPKNPSFYSQKYSHVFLRYAIRSVEIILQEQLQIGPLVQLWQLKMLDNKTWLLQLKLEKRCIIIVRESLLLKENFSTCLPFPESDNIYYIVIYDRWDVTMGAAFHNTTDKWLGKSPDHFLIDGGKQEEVNSYMKQFDHTLAKNMMCDVKIFAHVIPSSKNIVDLPTMLLQFYGGPLDTYLDYAHGHVTPPAESRVTCLTDIVKMQTFIGEVNTYTFKDGWLYFNKTRICRTKDFRFRSSNSPTLRELKFILEKKNTNVFLAFFEMLKK